MNPITSFLVLVFAAAGLAAGFWLNLYLGALLLGCAVVIGMSLKVAKRVIRDAARPLVYQNSTDICNFFAEAALQS